jgi:hypothetical protein
MKQIDHFIKIKKSDLSYMCTFLEVFEGMAALRTPNPKPGEDTVVHIMLSPDYEEQYDRLMEELRTKVPWEEVEP